MKVFCSFAVALTLPFVQACSRTSQAADAKDLKALDRACRVAAAAGAAGDPRDRPTAAGLARRARAVPRRGTPWLSLHRAGAPLERRRLLHGGRAGGACLESIEPGDPAALLLRGHVLHQLHRFGEAEAIARRLVTLREFVLDFGLLGDVLMEQGRLDEAAAAYQKMIDLKPFYQSYTRAAHLRWLKGDLDGAIEMMQRRDQGGQPARSGIGRVGLLAAGGLRAAARPAGRSGADDRRVVASTSPTMPRRCSSRGRIQLAAEALRGRGRHAGEGGAPQSAPRIPVGARRRAALARTGPTKRASVEQQLVGAGLRRSAHARALSVDAPRGRRKAVALARQELEKRADVFTLDALAWALASAGEIDEASALMARALAEGTAGRAGSSSTPRSSPPPTAVPPTPARWARKAQRAPLHAASLGAGGAPHGNRDITPKHEVMSNEETATRAAADRCSGTPAVAGAGAGVQPHGCAAHHAGRRGEHDRRVRVRLAALRTEVPDDGARRLPARGAGHRPEQVQLRRRRALRDPRRHRQRRGEGPHDARLSVQVRHDLSGTATRSCSRTSA